MVVLLGAAGCLYLKLVMYLSREAHIAANDARGTACFMDMSLKSIIIGMMLKAPEMPAILEIAIRKKTMTEPMISFFTFKGSVKGIMPWFLIKPKTFVNRLPIKEFAVCMKEA